VNIARLSVLLGILTTLLFLGVGLTLIAIPSAERVGALLCALAVFRGVLVVRELVGSREEEEP